MIEGSDVGFEALPADTRQKPGPKPLHEGLLSSDRDQLIQMLEFYWPELEPLCRPKPNPHGLRRVLESIPHHLGGYHAYAAQHLLKHLPELLKVLVGDRFRRDPRQIANAFAGFPKISIWTSLKRCQAKPCNIPIGNRTIRAYIRRRHPELHGRLIADYSLVNFAAALRSHRSNDTMLIAFGAQHLYQVWKQCEPDYSSIGVRLIDLKK
jgi:hypothetical protein